MKNYEIKEFPPVMTGTDPIIYGRYKKPKSFNIDAEAEAWQKIMQRLKNKLIEKKIVYDDIAKELNISSSSISRTLSGKHIPNLSLFIKICQSIDEDFSNKLASIIDDL